MAKRVKTNYDRGYVNAMDKIRVFIESSSKVMYVDTREYKNEIIQVRQNWGDLYPEEEEE